MTYLLYVVLLVALEYFTGGSIDWTSLLSSLLGSS
jgi:hypothetical protein